MKTLNEITFKNDSLERAVKICKENNIKVYAFQKDGTISQVFMVDSTGRIGTVSASFGGLSYATVHKGDRTNGTGFGLSGMNGCDIASIEKINECIRTNRPNWATGGAVEKYKNWEDYLSKPINKILTYFEI